MGTAYIRNGCDGDYQDVAGDGACDYVDTCGQFGTDRPTQDTLAPTASPTATPTDPVPAPTFSPSAAPTTNPTKNPVDQPLSTDLKLVLRGTLNDFINEATSYSGGDKIVLGKQCIEDAMALDANPQLDDVDITVTKVDRGSVHIYYTLTAWDSDLLTLAENNIISSVSAGTLFYADSGSSNSFKMMQHVVITAQHFTFEDDGKWWESTMVWTLVIVGLMVLCCIGGGCIWLCRRCRHNKLMANVEWLDDAQDMEMAHQPTVDVSTPFDEEDVEEAGQNTGTTVNPSMYNVVHSNSVFGKKEQDPFNF